ncbi:hypothetical protein LP419_23400 [Massilia sp. H-1]|nr:hypothetical protein LP419_23400 [Massilia sp. H-1]
MLALSLPLAQAQNPAPRIAVQAASPADVRLADIDRKIKALEDKLSAVQAENAELKQQLSQQKTSIKAIDMVVGDFTRTTFPAHVAAYERHVHFINHVRFGGFETIKARETGPLVRVMLAGEKAMSGPASLTSRATPTSLAD